ncbi:phospholipid/cholesterol/gamma-HCH transport system permease protein [Roseivirga ehrenbergii]|uniref:ABC transporter permease n=1 Tax=Roseivirga ehrenbergii (strain DSM 102268 / JCM 13514 / KCTC 12282 / NCIMB 14502 / KMM 6017) TaxID=279360 RepID=A0A150X6L0_ROSEK|nr:ABC transporter permease [Roseivirga ehrenbergii]KYG74367.1 ABC transporter permease [Roseivirga ehrenbergii]TCL14334.1 phospholipid/cholesterol/gamma-HCH transport system permease protein [Roseivirga ehrenbergii]
MKSLGKYLLFISSLFKNRESFKTYVKLTLDECMLVGINSIVLVGLVSLFIGAVSTLQTAYNLVNPLIPDSVVGLVVRDLTILELAPTITAIIFAGKVGSSIAGNLGTMRITEQIDALEVMGINSSSYLVLPKIVGTLIMYPLLVILAGVLAIFGGFLAAKFGGVVSTADYFMGLKMDFNQFTVSFALIKSVVFGFLVSSISSYMGFFTRGGALEVGQASTRAVTVSCIAILFSDFILAQLLLVR